MSPASWTFIFGDTASDPPTRGHSESAFGVMPFCIYLLLTQGGHLVDVIPGSEGQSDLRSQELSQRAEETFKASR